MGLETSEYGVFRGERRIGMTKGLDARQLRQHRKAIDRVAAKERGITILKGASSISWRTAEWARRVGLEAADVANPRPLSQFRKLLKKRR